MYKKTLKKYCKFAASFLSTLRGHAHHAPAEQRAPTTAPTANCTASSMPRWGPHRAHHDAG
eukprot:scaffold77621_cov65-Phaeocystis_antarctica.AAC.7